MGKINGDIGATAVYILHINTAFYRVVYSLLNITHFVYYAYINIIFIHFNSLQTVLFEYILKMFKLLCLNYLLCGNSIILKYLLVSCFKGFLLYRTKY